MSARDASVTTTPLENPTRSSSPSGAARGLVNDGVSLATIRKRLGHKNLQTTLRYAEQTDAELRRWRRHAPLIRGHQRRFSIADNKRSRNAANYR